MCEAALRGKAKQTGWPRHKEAATQSHVAAKPSQSMSPPPESRNAEPLTLPLEPHKLLRIPCAWSQEEKSWRKGGGRANSDSYSPNVTTLQRGPHDTATKSELMDSFLSPVNMTGGVCVRVRGCGRGTEAVRVPVCPIEGAHGPMSLV